MNESKKKQIFDFISIFSGKKKMIFNNKMSTFRGFSDFKYVKLMFLKLSILLIKLK